MMPLTDAERRLLVETAFAGINHGLQRQVRAILPAFPCLVADENLRAICLAILFAGLNEPGRARQLLVGMEIPEADSLRSFLV